MSRCVCKVNSAAVVDNHCGRLGDIEVLLELKKCSFNIICGFRLLLCRCYKMLFVRRAACRRDGPVTIHFAEQEFDFLESFRIAGQST